MGVMSVVPLQGRSAGKTLNPQPDGTVTVSNADGTVVAVDPNGIVSTRPAGTAGAYERARRVGNILEYNPIPGKSFLFEYYG